jgi:hypothetical protein
MNLRRHVGLGFLCVLTTIPAEVNAQGDEPKTTAIDLSARVDEQQARIESLEANLDEMRADSGAEPENRIRVYGFMDTGLQWTRAQSDKFSNVFSSKEPTFVSGNNNIYFDARPDPKWRALLETRYTFYPHGSEAFDSQGGYSRTDTTVYDVTSPSGRNRIRWGGVFIERATIEWRHRDWLQLTAGYFLTPYGIWNIDHGTPTLISLILPNFQVEEAIPQRQTGLQAKGNWVFDTLSLDYSVYISNGRTSTLVDLTADKAVGGRLALSFDDRYRWQLGASAYHGTSQDVSKALDFSDGGFGLSSDLTYALTESAGGVDFSFDRGPLRFRAETLMHAVQYREGLHAVSSFGPPGQRQPNSTAYYGYALLAYRLVDWIEPYVYFESRTENRRTGLSDSAHTPSLGLNIYFTPAAQLKLQYATPRFFNDTGPNPSQYNMNYFVSRLVLAF